jgi:hypothetical protein
LHGAPATNPCAPCSFSSAMRGGAATWPFVASRLACGSAPNTRLIVSLAPPGKSAEISTVRRTVAFGSEPRTETIYFCRCSLDVGVVAAHGRRLRPCGPAGRYPVIYRFRIRPVEIAAMGRGAGCRQMSVALPPPAVHQRGHVPSLHRQIVIGRDRRRGIHGFASSSQPSLRRRAMSCRPDDATATH